MDSPKKLCMLLAIIYFMYSSTSDASCSLPPDLKNSDWEYNYTLVPDNVKKSTNIKIGTFTIQHFVDYLKVTGTTLNDWTCIDSLDISVTTTVVVFKSDSSFSDRPGNNLWLYLCMKLTKITTDLYYFYLLSDINSSTEPDERAFMSADNAPTSSTVCQYTGSPKIRTLRKQGSNDVLPNDASLCEPWNSACDVDDRCDPNPCQNNGTCVDLTDSFNCTCAPGWEDVNCTTVMTCEYPSIVPHTTFISSGNELDDTITFSCAVGYVHISGDLVRTCRSDGMWEGSPINCDASCALPEDLKNTVWEYNYTDVANNEEQTTNLYIANTTLPDSVINVNDGGTIVNNWNCIASLDISETTNVLVFKSDASFPSSGGDIRLYLCMKLTKVTPDLFYFHLLSDIATSLFPNERVFKPETDNSPADNATICSTFCQYTDSPKIRTLRRQDSSVTLPSNISLCEPCDSACEEATTMMTSLETPQITTLPSTSSASSNTETTELRITTTDLKDKTTLETKPTESMYRCLENTDRFDIKWNRTAGNTLVTVSCTGEYTGTVSRNCSSSGMWDEPDYTQCTSKSIKNLIQQMDKLLAGDSEFPLVSTTLGNLANITKSNNELRTGDIVTASALLGDIAKYVTNDTDKISVDQLENFGSICNELLDENYHQSWKELKDKGTSGVTALVKAVTEYTSAFHNVLDGTSSITVIKENIVITVGKSSSPEITVPDRQTNDSWITDSGTEMKLKQSMCSDLTGYSCTFFRNISGLFPKYLLLNRKVLPFEGIYDVNSIIADVSIESGSCSDYSLKLRFGHLLGNHSRPVCGFWDFNASNTVNGAWSSFGSLVAESGESYTLCKYNHTTNFAILMSPGRTPSPHNFPLSMISAIGCGVSILFLVVTIVVHIVLWRSNRVIIITKDAEKPIDQIL